MQRWPHRAVLSFEVHKALERMVQAGTSKRVERTPFRSRGLWIQGPGVLGAQYQAEQPGSEKNDVRKRLFCCIHRRFLRVLPDFIKGPVLREAGTLHDSQ